MNITNRTPHAIIGVGWHKEYSYGDDVRIEPGETKDVSDTYLGMMWGADCYVHLEGEIVCHSGPDDNTGSQVIKGKSLCLKSGDRGVTVRHCDDEPDPHIVEWRWSVLVS